MADTLEIGEMDDRKKIDEERKDELVGWVMSHVNPWRSWRDQQFGKKWAEYYRLWRGFWAPDDKSRESERSRLISPALQQAIEMTVAEMEEATFGRGTWIDISDDYEDPQKDDILALRDQLLSDFDYCHVPSAISEVYLNGALYGTGIGKVMIGRHKSGEYAGQFKVWVEPVAPQNFVIDPSARSIDDALGCAHEIAVPRHRVTQKQMDGVYYRTTVGHWNGEAELFDLSGKQLTKDVDKEDVVFITEYHGLVPRRLTAGNYNREDHEFAVKDEEGRPVVDDGDLVECIITIANKGILLREVENPYENSDRAIIAYQHETVPNQFWGRGVSEKGYNPQKALDAELRARMDALGLLTYPIMGADATRLPRGIDLKLRPGRLFLLNGRPSEILEPINFGNLDPATFQNTGDLERMVQMGTGAMDSATPLDTARRNETVGGMSQMQAGFIKRAKRTMQNVERHFLGKMVQKSLWRYMQFDPERYPADFKFIVRSSMGIMARELEQQILAQLIQVVPPESQLFPVIIKGIIENGASPNKDEMLKTVDRMLQPDPMAEQIKQIQQQLTLENMVLTNKELEAKVAKLLAEAEAHRATAEYTGVKSELEDDKIEAMFAQTVISNKEADVARMQVDQKERQMAQDAHDAEEDRKVQRETAKSKANKPKPKGNK